MASMKLPISVPEGTNFTCQSCGRCCQGWTVTVDQATVDRLRAHDWGADPFEALRGGEHPYRIRLVNERCFFLDPQNRCRIHTEISYDAKPPVCRAFPLAILEVSGRQYGRLSYWCPTVTANQGRPLDQQRGWLKDTSAIAGRRTVPLTVEGTRELSTRQFDRVHAALRRCLTHTALPVRDRLAAGSAIVRRLAASGAADPVSIVEAAEAEGLAELVRQGTSGGRMASGRRVLTLYLLQDRGPSRWAILPRLAAVLLFNTGVYRLRSRATGARASWRAIRRVSLGSSPAGDELMTRYFCGKLDSRRYIAEDASLVTGFNLLVAAYAVIEVLARMSAAEAGRTTCGAEDVQLAVSAADLLVVEHPGLDQTGPHHRITEETLGNADLAAGLLNLLAVSR